MATKKFSERLAKFAGPLPALSKAQRDEYEKWLGDDARDSDAKLAEWLKLNGLRFSTRLQLFTTSKDSRGSALHEGDVVRMPDGRQGVITTVVTALYIRVRPEGTKIGGSVVPLNGSEVTLLGPG